MASEQGNLVVLYISYRERRKKGEKKIIYFINQELLHTYIIEHYIYISHKKIKDKK